MTGGQGALTLGDTVATVTSAAPDSRAARPAGELKIVIADADELAMHAQSLLSIDKASGGKTLWKSIVGEA
jgi:DNA polymerase III subunit epsilon